MDRPDRHRKASFGVTCLWAAPLILAGYVLVAPFVWKWTSTRGVEYTLPSGVVVLDQGVLGEPPPWVKTIYAPVVFLREAPLVGPVLNGYFEFVEKL